jgi:hypothetical protein
MTLDLSGENLRGRSFKGQNLEGANFSGADIRSADFTGANLAGANFSHAQAGLQKRWAIFLICVSWLLCGVAGILSGFARAMIAEFFDISSVIAIAIAIPAAICFTIAIVIAGAIGGAIAIVIAGAICFTIAFDGAITKVIVGALFSVYCGSRIIKEDERNSLIRKFAIAFAACGGTSFRNANLTDANFTGATLKSTDFRGASLMRTRFQEAKMLDRVRPGTTYLQNAQVRRVLVRGEKV